MTVFKFLLKKHLHFDNIEDKVEEGNIIFLKQCTATVQQLDVQ